MLSIPISVFSSRVSLGRALRRARLFVIPDEADPPRELRTVRALAERAGPTPGFVDAVVDPGVNAVVGAAVPSPRSTSDRVHARRSRLVATAVVRGPHALSDPQKRRVLMDPIALAQLHRQVTTSPTAHPAWRSTGELETVAERAALAEVS
jgi:membrane glycosyltransferase